jgi:hypothetical protein
MTQKNTDKTTASATPDKGRTFTVITHSAQYGGESFGEYDTLKEAYEAIARMAKAAAKLDDGIIREYSIVGE